MPALLEVRNLVKRFRMPSGLFSKPSYLNAVQDVSFSIAPGETLGLVGESGCGKSTLGRCLLKLLPVTSGTVHFDGKEVTSTSKNEMVELRRKMQIIFQDPFSSLNPRMTVESAIEEPMILHRLYSTREERYQRLVELLKLVGLREDMRYRYPHEFSGGQRQRVGIARALAVRPQFIVCDEPVSALDVSIQAQIINLLIDLQERFGLTYLFISHDLKVVEHLSHRVAVMYLGKIVELGQSRELYENPQHPYTRALLSAVPIPDPEYRKERIVLTGDPPRPTAPPSGCQFHTRCFMAEPDCQTTLQSLEGVAGEQSSHQVACFKVDASSS